MNSNLKNIKESVLPKNIRKDYSEAAPFKLVKYVGFDGVFLWMVKLPPQENYYLKDLVYSRQCSRKV